MHKHENDDEVFFILEGELTIETEKGNFDLKKYEGIRVPKMMMHRPGENHRLTTNQCIGEECLEERQILFEDTFEFDAEATATVFFVGMGDVTLAAHRALALRRVEFQHEEDIGRRINRLFRYAADPLSRDVQAFGPEVFFFICLEPYELIDFEARGFAFFFHGSNSWRIPG